MTQVVSVLGGGLLGWVLGIAVWLAARHLTVRYQPQPSHVPPSGPGQHLGAARGAISLSAGLTQAAMALWGAYVGWRAPGLEQIVPALVITGLLATITLVDYRVRRIPNALVLALLLWAVAQVAWLGQPTLGAAALGLLVGAALFGLIYLVGRGAMGLGDVKLAAALGAVLGFPLIVSGLLYGALAGGAAALILLVTRRARRKDYMAYGPYLALGSWLVAMGALGLWL